MNDNRYTAEFPPELMEFIDRDPAVCAIFYSMKHGHMSRDKALVALAVHQTQTCAKLMKIASDAVARSCGPQILIKLGPESQKDLQFLRPLPVG